ncbi:MAG: hypothetical protein ACKVOO_02045 [Burkholderiaceae bacterium]
MKTQLFFLSLLIAVIGPIIAISYLKPILKKVLGLLCDADGGAEFWVRSAYLLAVSGTLLLMLSFGQFDEQHNLVDVVRRSLWLVLAGVFATVAIISRNVWAQVRHMLAVQSAAAAPQPAARAPVIAPAPAAAPLDADAFWNNASEKPAG